LIVEAAVDESCVSKGEIALKTLEVSIARLLGSAGAEVAAAHAVAN
jgi:hypothetical protein